MVSELKGGGRSSLPRGAPRPGRQVIRPPTPRRSLVSNDFPLAGVCGGIVSVCGLGTARYASRVASPAPASPGRNRSPDRSVPSSTSQLASSKTEGCHTGDRHFHSHLVQHVTYACMSPSAIRSRDIHYGPIASHLGKRKPVDEQEKGRAGLKHG